jgi:peptidylprolyl isomerase
LHRVVHQQERSFVSIEKPEVDFPGGEPPADLEIKDIWEGDGPEAKAGDVVSVHYVGVSFSSGEEFDSSWNRGTPLRFQLGVGQVISGWDKGVQGMKVGGRRQLIIPPHLAYGERGAGRAIGPNETLIFVCDLVAV